MDGATGRTGEVDGLRRRRSRRVRYICMIFAAVEFFIYFYKETAYTSTNTDLALHKIAQHLLPVLFQTFASASEEENP